MLHPTAGQVLRAVASSPSSGAARALLLGFGLLLAGVFGSFTLHSAPVAADLTCATATYTWVGAAGDGVWSNPANWTPARVPSTADTACVRSATPITISGLMVGNVVVEPGTELVATSRVSLVQGTFVNNGTLSFTSPGGLYQRCSTRLVNNGTLKVTG